MKLVLLSFGERLENHYQATFSILSFLSDPAVKQVGIVTDRPDLYRYFGDRVEIFTVDGKVLSEWKGDSQFFWRIKIKAIELVAMNSDDDLLYIDSDTFLVTNLAAVAQGLSVGHGFMHLPEGALSKLNSKTERSMWRILQGQQFAGVTITEQTVMWNAGVIGIPRAKKHDIMALTLAICDAMCATPCTRRLLEQFSFSLALNALTQLQSCEQSIAHYWGNKPEWNKEISAFLLRSVLSDHSIDEDVALVRQFDFSHLPLVKKERGTHRRFVRWIDSLFPAKNIEYFKR